MFPGNGPAASYPRPAEASTPNVLQVARIRSRCRRIHHVRDGVGEHAWAISSLVHRKDAEIVRRHGDVQRSAIRVVVSQHHGAGAHRCIGRQHRSHLAGAGIKHDAMDSASTHRGANGCSRENRGQWEGADFSQRRGAESAPEHNEHAALRQVSVGQARVQVAGGVHRRAQRYLSLKALSPNQHHCGQHPLHRFASIHPIRGEAEPNRAAPFVVPPP